MVIELVVFYNEHNAGCCVGDRNLKRPVPKMMFKLEPNTTMGYINDHLRSRMDIKQYDTLSWFFFMPGEPKKLIQFIPQQELQACMLSNDEDLHYNIMNCGDELVFLVKKNRQEDKQLFNQRPGHAAPYPQPLEKEVKGTGYCMCSRG